MDDKTSGSDPRTWAFIFHWWTSNVKTLYCLVILFYSICNFSVMDWYPLTHSGLDFKTKKKKDWCYSLRIQQFLPSTYSDFWAFSVAAISYNISNVWIITPTGIHYFYLVLRSIFHLKQMQHTPTDLQQVEHTEIRRRHSITVHHQYHCNMFLFRIKHKIAFCSVWNAIFLSTISLIPYGDCLAGGALEKFLLKWELFLKRKCWCPCLLTWLPGIRNNRFVTESQYRLWKHT